MAGIVVDHAFINVDSSQHTQCEVGKSVEASIDMLNAFDPKDATQLMFATQMAAIHRMQQQIMWHSNNIGYGQEHFANHINAMVKLSNS